MIDFEAEMSYKTTASYHLTTFPLKRTFGFFLRSPILVSYYFSLFIIICIWQQTAEIWKKLNMSH